MSWHTYQSLHDLAAVAELIVIGTVTSADPKQDTDRFVRIDGVPFGIPFTVTTVEVTNVLRGAVTAGEAVTIWQEGAEGMPTVTFPTYQVFQVGQSYLLFLSHNERAGHHHYLAIDGPGGVYQIIVDTVYSCDGTEQGMHPWFLGQSVDRATALITEALG